MRGFGRRGKRFREQGEEWGDVGCRKGRFGGLQLHMAAISQVVAQASQRIYDSWRRFVIGGALA